MYARGREDPSPTEDVDGGRDGRIDGRNQGLW